MLGGLVAIARSIQGGLPGALARLGSVAAVAGVTVGLILATSTAWPPSSSPRPGQPRHRRNKRPALRLLLAEETINFALAPWSTSCLPA
jgi:hypothetical protein